MTHSLLIQPSFPIHAQNAGLFISRGLATHPTRVIDSHELIFVKQGELEMWEEEHIFSLQAGHVLHLFPGRRHGSTQTMPPGLRFFWVHFDVLDASTPPDGLHIPQVKRLSQPERLEQLFRMFIDEQETNTLSPCKANLLLLLMLTEIAEAHEAQAAAEDDSNVVATWARTYIRLHYDKPITASKVAEAVRYNPDYLGRIYRKVYGCTLTEAIHRQRVHIACHHLLETEQTVEQIALRCGFNDPDYFRRIFRRQMGISPGEYREQYTHVRVNTH